jgi:hypothetical protein
MQNLASLAAQPENATVVGAIRQASARSGVDFSYLLRQASTESSLNPTAQASTSSASGLYQFIDQTWLTEMASHGSEYGLSAQAAAISVDSDGHASVSNPALRSQIMALKNDPTVAAEMAASFTKDNQAALEAAGIGQVGPTELYLAHFLGAGGAAKFLSSMKQNATQAGSTILPQAADSNEPVFFHNDGTPKTLSEIYNHFAAKFTGSAPVVSTAVASASATASSAYASATKFLDTIGGAQSAAPSLDAVEAFGSGKTSLYEMLLFSQLGDLRPTAQKKAEMADQVI